VRQYVALRDTTADAGSANLIDVDVVVARYPANERRRAPSANIVWRSRRRRSGRARTIAVALRLGGCRRYFRPLANGNRGVFGRGLGPFAGLTDGADDGIDRDRFAFLDPNLGEHSGGRSRNLCVDFVGCYLEERFVALDRVANLLDPANDCPFGNRLAHLGHDDGCRHVLYVYRCAVRCVSRLADCFREGGMCVNRLDELLDCAFEPQRHGRFGNELGRS
jgi:hypothetical protein